MIWLLQLICQCLIRLMGLWTNSEWLLEESDDPWLTEDGTEEWQTE